MTILELSAEFARRIFGKFKEDLIQQCWCEYLTIKHEHPELPIEKAIKQAVAQARRQCRAPQYRYHHHMHTYRFVELTERTQGRKIG